MKKKWKSLLFVLLAFILLYIYNRHHITAEEIPTWQLKIQRLFPI